MTALVVRGDARRLPNPRARAVMARQAVDDAAELHAAVHDLDTSRIAEIGGRLSPAGLLSVAVALAACLPWEPTPGDIQWLDQFYDLPGAEAEPEPVTAQDTR